MEVKVNSLKAWLLASRPKTLAAAVAPVMVGVPLWRIQVDSSVGMSLFCHADADCC